MLLRMEMRGEYIIVLGTPVEERDMETEKEMVGCY
jgi:hypothetical protein